MNQINQSPKLDVLIVIVTYNSAFHIEKCLLSIASFYKAINLSSVKVCVVDNASSDNTPQILLALSKKFTWLDICYLSVNIGFGRGNNVGFRKFDADAYVLLNADAYLLADSLTASLDKLQENPKIGVIGLPLVYPNGSPQIYSYIFSSWHRWLFSMLGIGQVVKLLIRNNTIQKLLKNIPYGRDFSRIYSQVTIDTTNSAELINNATLHTHSADWVCGAAMILSRELIKKTDGFDSQIFLYGEDEDICIQAHKLNLDVITLDTAPIAHMLGWKSTGTNAIISDHKYKSLSYFISKNITGKINRCLMYMLLPFYVYGYKGPIQLYLNKKRCS